MPIPVWHSGIVVVDMDTGAIVSRLACPMRPTGRVTRVCVVGAPSIVGSIGDRWRDAHRPGLVRVVAGGLAEPRLHRRERIYRISFAGGAFGYPRPVPTAYAVAASWTGPARCRMAGSGWRARMAA